MEYKNLKNELVNWLKKEVKNANAKGVVFGLSGGIDSAVIAALSKLAFGDNCLGIIMPINSIKEDEKDAMLVANSLDLNVKKIDLSNAYEQLIKVYDSSENSMSLANVKPRLRMITLYYYAQSNNYLVVGTSNLSEFMSGYFTKYGDSGCDIMPLVNLVKTEIFELAKELKLPEKIITKKPSAGLWENQTDEDEMGFTYKELDDYILSRGEVSDSVKNRIEDMMKKSEHKRNLPKSFKIDR